jgi:uncharacterized protein YndB with AHSA1/START domain
MKPGTIRVEHVYRHPPSSVWRALTDPVLHALWFVPGDIRPVVVIASRSTWASGDSNPARSSRSSPSDG